MVDPAVQGAQQQHPEDADDLCSLGAAAVERGRYDEAMQLFTQALGQSSEHAGALRGIGLTLREQGRLEDATQAYDAALRSKPSWGQAAQEFQELRQEIEAIDAAIDRYERSGSVPAIDCSEEAGEQSTSRSRRLNLAENLFDHFGVLVLENIIDRDLIESTRRYFEEKYRSYFDNKHHPDALLVGDKGVLITVEIAGHFNDPVFYANPSLVPILERALGSNFVLSGFGSVVALPGSSDQVLHADHSNLFEDDGLSGQLPCHAATVAMPLIGFTEETGTTRVYPGTHRSRPEPSEFASLPFQEVLLQPGSCMMWDYRLLHQGTANRSDQVRPLLYNVYARPWFRDSESASQQSLLLIDEEQIEQIPEQHRHLFLWIGKS